MRLGGTSKEVSAVPNWQFKRRATGGSLGFLGAQKVLGGVAIGRRKKKSLFSCFKELVSICITGSGL